MRYIGSKRNLLNEIKLLLDSHTNGTEQTFLDLFAGTNSVGLFFKPYYTIYSNDLLAFSYTQAKAVIENNVKPDFKGLDKCGISNVLAYLSNLSVSKDNYYERSYSPTGDCMYFTVDNAKRIDAIREKIDEWNNAGLLEENESSYLISTLIDSLPFISNITGTYGAYLKKWDKRALNDLELIFPTVYNNNRPNKSFNKNANDLVREVKADIIYIDPPYNGRQYASNYHVLENVTRHQKPNLHGKTKIFDWQSLKSDYAGIRTAYAAMEDLISHTDCTHIILSYNTEGIIPESDLISLLEKYAYDGNIEVKKIPYRKYQSKNKSENLELYELLIYIQRKPVEINNKINVDKAEKRSLKVKDKYNTMVAEKRYVKSPLNYIGGKYKLLKQILPLFPKNIHTFVDLFSGGANVGINVEAKKYIFNDINSRINELFRVLQNLDVSSVLTHIQSRIKEYGLSKTNEAGYLQFRSDYNQNPNPLDLYTLSSFSYNYQFRFNNDMQFNNPFGRNRSCFSENMQENLIRFSQRIKEMNAEFKDGMFDEFNINDLNSNDFVYLDPPYLITTGSYNDGNRGFKNWTLEQEQKMYDFILKLNKAGIKFALSNVLHHKGVEHRMLKEFINENKLNVYFLDYNYKNSSYNTQPKESVEVLITNYNP